MRWPDLSGQVALVMGGTNGLGLACGLALARHGAQVVLTYKWGSVSDAEVAALFAEVKAPAPLVLQADAGRPADTEETVRLIAERYGRIDILVANVCVVPLGGSLDAIRRRDLVRSMRYSVWPIRDYVARIRSVLGAPPARVIAMSSDGSDRHYPRYDYVALSKAALEALARDLHECGEVRSFILRTRQVLTTGFEEMFPAGSRDLLKGWFASFAVAPEAVGDAAVALASGAMDGLSGQAIVLDRGARFLDNLLTTAPELVRTDSADALVAPS